MAVTDDTLLLEEQDVQEQFFERGWTDGLPIVPPTPERVQALLDVVGCDDPELLIGMIPARRRGISMEKAAVNAVMAGCKPEYFPVVVAALESCFDQAFNLNTVLTSTGGAAIAVVVSGPIAQEIGMNARHNCLGSGNRANATIGRAVRLACCNVFGAKTGELDASSFGHQGKITFCFAEDPPPAPWRPLHERLGYGPQDTTVTVIPVEGVRQLAQQLNADAEGILRTFATSLKTPFSFHTGKGGQALMILGPEHARFCIEQGWTQERVCEFLYEQSRVTPRELEDAGVLLEVGAQHDMSPGPDGKIRGIASPRDIVLVTAGGEGAGWSAMAPGWAPTIHAAQASRRVRPSGEPLPDCGPDGCIVPAYPAREN
ncbi:MAG: hypothetical protein FJW96_01340 [Actinobacteria bacterium]|nr:hypothetical protein [Actinomycetota bacterium]